MERYTKRLQNGVASWAYPNDCYGDDEVRNKVFKSVHRQNACEKLAAIEDIMGDEYDLDELREMVQAKREGRCGVPPVKMHQKVFRVFNGEIYEEIVCGAIWEPLKPHSRWKIFTMPGGLPYFWHEVLGKTVFLTRADAEAALRREQDGNRI